MKNLLRYALALLLIAAAAAPALAENKGEKEIHALLNDALSAFKAKDLDKMMSFYEHSADLVAFDVIPPLQYTGWDAYKKDFADFFALFDGPINDEASDMAIAAEGNMGYSRMVEHVTGKGKNGQPMDMVVRVTDVYRKTNGKWHIIHEHVSVPVDLDTGKAVMQPGK
jgi:ketosteroid isomerase-like protein